MEGKALADELDGLLIELVGQENVMERFCYELQSTADAVTRCSGGLTNITSGLYGVDGAGLRRLEPHLACRGVEREHAAGHVSAKSREP